MTDPIDPFPDDEFAALRESSVTGSSVAPERGPNFFEQISEQLGELDPRLVVGAGVAALGIVTIVGFIALLALFRGRPNAEQPTVVVAVTSQPTLTPSLTFTPSLTAIASQTPLASSTTDLTATVTNLPALHFATLSEIKGSVEIRSDANSPFRKVNETLTITPGTTVLTGENSSAKVTLSDGSLVRLSSQTQFTIIEMSGTATRPNTVMGLDFGKVWAIVGGIGEGIFQIKLPLGVASVRGTFMSAESNSTDQIEIVACLEGKCSYRNDNGQVLMGTLQQTESIKGGPPSTPHRMDPNQIEDWNKLKIPEVITLTPTSTIVPSRTIGPTNTPIPTRTPTGSATVTKTGTLATATGSVTTTRTITATSTASRTSTVTPSRTNTVSPTASKTNTPSNTPTATTTPGPAHHLDFNIQPPSSVTSGQTFTVQVTIKDPSGRTVTYATNNITLSLFSGPGTLGGTLTQPPVAGIATFNNLTLNTPGSGYVLQAQASPSVTAPTVNSDPITVTIGAIDHFNVSAPGAVNKCTVFDVTVTAMDVSNNVITGYTGTVNFTGDGNPFAFTPGSYSFVGGDNGTKTFVGGFRFNSNTGPIAVGVSDGSHSGSANVNINSGSYGATTLYHVFNINPTGTATPTDITVGVKDACENIITGYTGTIHFTSSPADATLPGDYTFTSPGDNGVHVFTGGASFPTNGPYTVRGEEVGNPAIFGEQTGINVP